MDVLDTLRRYHILPSKGLAQNFLVAEWVYERILEASALQCDDIVLEIGPGLGTLTRQLAQRAGQVVAVELDRKMLPILDDALSGLANARVVQGDILEIDPVALLCDQAGVSEAGLSYHVVANLPYYITSSVLRHLLGARVRPQRLTLMVQREVAERITAEPGQMSLLALGVQVFGAATLLCRVPPSAFVPSPKVSSAVLHVQLYPSPLVPEEQLELFFRVARAGFGQKRKQLHNSLVAGLGLAPSLVAGALQAAQIDPTRRAQTLRIDEWLRLAGLLAESASTAP
jgi:16S rRNA (adenine1518-N6/adenine1519-N6)-dimethyltransferase